MSLHHQCYEISTTCYLRCPRPAGGFWILAELEVNVTVSDQSEEQEHYCIEAIAFADRCNLDGVPLSNKERPRELCEMYRPKGTYSEEYLSLWKLLCSGIDMQHVAECVSEQKGNHF